MSTLLFEVQQQAEEQEMYRREALGAFAHEVRTPLTSIRMVLELARRESAGEKLELDPELAGMLTASIDDLQQLADDLQEASRLERGRLTLSTGPCELRAAFEAASARMAPALQFQGGVPAGIEGPWDGPRLVRALTGFAEAVNRVGDGSGIVQLAASTSGGRLLLHFSSGVPGGEPREIAADAGFSFFQARLIVLAMGGTVEATRSKRYLQITASLPL